MPLQKSFSDQNHSAKARQQQQQRQLQTRNKSFHGAPTAKHNASKKPLQEKPHVPVSTATRNKLSIFQFGGQPEKQEKNIISLLSDDGKENPITETTRTRKNTHNGQTPNQEKKTTAERPILSDLSRKDGPSTPASRLALPDLIRMSDLQRAVKDMSPDDRLSWDYQPDPGSSVPSLRRAKKRARSSSPTTSSPAYRSSILSRGGNPNLQIDPGSELWGRYLLNASNAPTPQGPSVPALAHLMHTSSPQPSKEGRTARSVAGLRRANSCGNQFPKRRRLGGSDVNVFTESVNIGPSKLSVLIEKVQQELTQSRQLMVSQEDSSPSRGLIKRRVSSVDESSPIAREEAQAIIDLPENSTSIIIQTEQTITDKSSLTKASSIKSDSSDYGDFDDDELDVSVLEVLEAKPVKNILNTSTGYTSKPSRLPPDPTPKLCRPPTPAKEIMSTLDDDLFGDFDDGLLETDLEQVVSQFDRRATGVNSFTEAERGGHVLKSDSDDEFGDDGLDDVDFDAAEVTATQSIQKGARGLKSSAQKVQRYLVTNVSTNVCFNARGRQCKEKILMLRVENMKTKVLVKLRGIWLDTPVNVKAYVHVIGTFDVNSQCIIDDDHNMLILHPDHLVSSTVVADAFGCPRRAVLQDRVKATGDTAAPMIYGTILHEIFQAAMVANRWDSEWLSEIIEDIATKHIEDLYTIKIQLSVAMEYLQSKMGELQAWAELFVSSQPKPKAKVEAGNGTTVSMCVSKLLDVEEHVWSPMYGLKGNIDATVQITIQESNKQQTLTVPFEVKTGKRPNIAHRAQTALYNLLLSDRYDMQVAYGILYYMETSETIRIPNVRRDLCYMIKQRNELACFVRERDAQLPPMLKNENMCGRCYAKTTCFIYHKIADNGDGETSGMKSKFDEVVNHLTEKHKEFFLKWDGLLTKEEKESLKFRRELWTMLSSEREKLGRCFSNVIIEPGSAREEFDNPKINRYHYTFIKEESPIGFSFLDSQIIVGEPIVISDEKGHFALANGFVSKVRKQKITVAVDRRLHNARIRQPGFDEIDNQVFSSIMQVGMSPSKRFKEKPDPNAKPTRYRVDKDEFSNGMATVRNNLVQVMASPFASRKLRDLVVDLHAPRFKVQSTAYVLKDRDSLNVDQQKAIQKVMSAEDYALVLGMPGTGKTTTIAHIIRALVSQGKSVLLTSYTHTAVDNILLKLRDDEIGILRLGAPAKIHDDVREFATLAATTKKSFDEIKTAWHGNPIVATTCLGINHAIFKERTFDYCIVDEASQITLPVCLGPIRLAKTFVLVGDHYQLPPLVQNEEARTGGLDISLFKHLSDTHPTSVVNLEHQYRMCEDVQTLSNNLIYNGRLKCGSREVANRQINIPNMDGLCNHHFSPATISRSQKTICPGPRSGCCWIRDLLDPAVKVAFLNTDTIPGSCEEQKGNRIINPTEATICTQLVESLLSVGVAASSVGVMTHYRSQLALLKHGLRHHGNVEMHTADRFQGRDKEVIILSLVRSNEAKSIGELLKDWRRINVAFTRAKTKLLVIGSRETLKGNGKDKEGKEEMVAQFIKLMEEKHWVFDMPKGALEDHYFEDGATQISATATSKPSHTQFRGFKDEQPVSNVKRKAGLDLSVLGGKENRRRQPVNKISGNRPFKMPRMSVLNDVVNDSLG